MEDVYRVVPELDGDPHTSFVAVYDGHGGKGMASFQENQVFIALIYIYVFIVEGTIFFYHTQQYPYSKHLKIAWSLWQF